MYQGACLSLATTITKQRYALSVLTGALCVSRKNIVTLACPATTSTLSSCVELNAPSDPTWTPSPQHASAAPTIAILARSRAAAQVATTSLTSG